MEQIDILNPDGSSAGFSSPRKKAHAEGLHHKSIHLWIVNSFGELLIQKRSLSKTAHAGLWDISCAGHIESGDSPEATVVKELKEELGLDINQTDFTYCFTIFTKNSYDSGRYIDNEFIDVFLMLRDIDLKDVCFDPVEVSDVKFLTLREFKALIMNKNPAFSPHYEEYNKMFEVPELKSFL